MSSREIAPSVSRWRLAVFVIFGASGVAFSSWVTRTPDIREILQVSNAEIGWIIFGLSAGSIVGLALSGRMVARVGARPVVAVGATLIGVGILLVGVGTGLQSIPLVAAGMIMTGLGFGLSEVALNIEGAALESVIGRSILPSLHGCYSLGSLAGAGLGALAIVAQVPVDVHLGVLGGATVVAPLLFLPFLPASTGREHGREATHLTFGERLGVWREPRTLLIGGVVLGTAFAEGAANDWLPLAIVDGYLADPVVGSVCFAIVVGAMTVGRLFGGRFVDRFGRVRVLQVEAVLAAAGILLVILGGTIPLLAFGCLLWGLGVALGFPLGISAAADNPVGTSARVSAVATLGYFAFLVGPPAIGFVGEEFGLLGAFYIVLALVVMAGLFSSATKPLAVVPTPRNLDDTHTG